MKALQWLLTYSISGKALAVKRVTDNKGKNTPVSSRSSGKHPGQRPPRLRR
ncbi:reverse transcriptase N-terminal domain-containing protein [Paraburkholderia sp.]|uniref:reverse transcriptase N-terminal domain-containing protein n=1 Tax=Paraburkholderia sp. TaxID=1926495 RepID=UPI003C4F40DE